MKQAFLDQRLGRLPPVERWPTKEEAASSRWFAPIQIGSLTAHERTWVPAMVPWRATDEGLVTPRNIAWYRRFAQGQPGVLVLEATGIRDVRSGPLLRIGHDRFVPGLRALVDAVREASEGRTKLFVQIIDFLRVRRRPPRERFFREFLEVTRTHRERLSQADEDERWKNAPEAEVRERLLRCDDVLLQEVLTEREVEAWRMGARERVTDTQLEHVAGLPRVLPERFASAARRAREAGFDGVELHYAHAYTMASFLSRRNDRTDGYGGSLAERVRLPLEVLDRVRKEVGRDYAIGCRYLGDEVIEGGSRIDDAVYYGVEFARAGMDWLSVSKGGKFEDARQPKVGAAVYPYTGPSGHECMPTVGIDARGPFSRNVELPAAIRAGVREAGFETPVVAAGGISTFAQAEQILADGEADIVAAARQSLADPDWFKKIRLGRGNEVRRCFFTNYCEGLDQAHKEVTCQRWDREHLDDAPLSLDGKRRLVAPPWSS